MDITIAEDTTSWQSLNNLTSITTGTALYIQNKAAGWVILQLADSQPTDSSEVGVILTDLAHGYAEKETDEDDSEVWVRPVEYGRECVINVQEA